MLHAVRLVCRSHPIAWCCVAPQASVDLARMYREHYKLAKEQLAAQPKGKQFNFDEQAIFMKFDLFTKRLNKLIDMFTTIHQFSTLEQHTHIEGLDQMIRNLNNIIDDVKRKPYDLLDFFRNQVCGGEGV